MRSSEVPATIFVQALLVAMVFAIPLGAAGSSDKARSSRTQSRIEARLSFKDIARFMSEDGNETLVLFVQHAAFYKLKPSNPDFAKIKKTLQKSMKERIWLNVTVDAQSLEILSAI